MASIRKATPAQGPKACRPKAGELFCVLGRHADGGLVHRHFKLEAGARNLRNELAAEHVGGAKVPGKVSREAFEAYGERWRASQVHRDPDAVRYALQRAYKLAGKVPVARFDGLRLQRLAEGACWPLLRPHHRRARPSMSLRSPCCARPTPTGSARSTRPSA